MVNYMLPSFNILMGEGMSNYERIQIFFAIYSSFKVIDDYMPSSLDDHKGRFSPG